MKLTLTFDEPPPIPVFCAVLDSLSRRFPHALLLMDKSVGMSWVLELGEPTEVFDEPWRRPLRGHDDDGGNIRLTEQTRKR